MGGILFGIPWGFPVNCHMVSFPPSICKIFIGTLFGDLMPFAQRKAELLRKLNIQLAPSWGPTKKGFPNPSRSSLLPLCRVGSAYAPCHSRGLPTERSHAVNPLRLLRSLHGLCAGYGSRTSFDDEASSSRIPVVFRYRQISSFPPAFPMDLRRRRLYFANQFPIFWELVKVLVALYTAETVDL